MNILYQFITETSIPLLLSQTSIHNIDKDAPLSWDKKAAGQSPMAGQTDSCRSQRRFPQGLKQDKKLDFPGSKSGGRELIQVQLQPQQPIRDHICGHPEFGARLEHLLVAGLDIAV